MDVALSLKIPEMANMRLPIVATRLPVLEELFGENSIAFVPSGDHEAFASKILELYRSPELRESLADKALLQSSTMVWENQFRAYRELLERLLTRPVGDAREERNLRR
jgi:glycosyltransferase involved in cell wall biosynthesis